MRSTVWTADEPGTAAAMPCCVQAEGPPQQQQVCFVTDALVYTYLLLLYMGPTSPLIASATYITTAAVVVRAAAVVKSWSALDFLTGEPPEVG